VEGGDHTDHMGVSTVTEASGRIAEADDVGPMEVMVVSEAMAVSEAMGALGEGTVVLAEDMVDSAEVMVVSEEAMAVSAEAMVDSEEVTVDSAVVTADLEEASVVEKEAGALKSEPSARCGLGLDPIPAPTTSGALALISVALTDVSTSKYVNLHNRCIQGLR